ncbi:hypothetical protein [Mesorhizobium sp. URHB0026]
MCLQRRRAATVQAAQIAAKAKRTNDIIIAGQPLTSLNLTWEFRGLDEDVVKTLKKGHNDAMAFIEDQQGERDGQQNGAVFRQDQLYPFLVALSRRFCKDTTKGGESDVVVLLALDDDQNAVLPFGFLSNEGPGGGAGSGDSLKPANPPSVEVGDHGELGNSDLLNWPSLDMETTSAAVTWRLDPLTFAKSLGRQNQFIVPTAKLPAVLHIAVLFNIKKLPFTSGNFALPRIRTFGSSATGSTIPPKASRRRLICQRARLPHPCTWFQTARHSWPTTTV